MVHCLVFQEEKVRNLPEEHSKPGIDREFASIRLGLNFFFIFSLFSFHFQLTEIKPVLFIYSLDSICSFEFPIKIDLGRTQVR